MSTRRESPFERRLHSARKSTSYDRLYRAARAEIDEIDAAVRTLLEALDEAREAAHLTKSSLAANVGLPPETIRRLFTAEGQNPTAATLIKLARALGQRITLVPVKKSRTPRRSAA